LKDTHGRAEGELRVGTASPEGGRAGGNIDAAPGACRAQKHISNACAPT